MLNIDKCIKKDGLILNGDIVGVACSGGMDSMTLLHFLNAHKKDYNCEVVAINIDHNLRKTSASDSNFVINYCKNNAIPYQYKSLDIKKLCEKNKLTLEQGAREGRYNFFKELLDKNIVTKIALGHHISDQAETVLLNLFRGSGISGARGMDTSREGKYIRPLLTTTKKDIEKYIKENNIPYVIDETNAESIASRNYLRNVIMPMIRDRWPNFETSISGFSRACKIDDEYLNNSISKNAVILENSGTCKISLAYVSYPLPIIYRVLRRAFHEIGVFADIETRHLNIIISLGIEAENGSKINLPHGITVLKEYGYLTITNREFKPTPIKLPFQKGKVDVPSFGVIEMTPTKNLSVENYTHLIDRTNLPKNSCWRFRQEGDIFTKFGGGTKSLSDYFIDKKIPSRLRGITPVLASGNEIFIIAGIEISDKIKINKNTTIAWGVNIIKF